MRGRGRGARYLCHEFKDHGLLEVLEIVDPQDERTEAPDEWYELNLGEAYFAIGDDERALRHRIGNELGWDCTVAELGEEATLA